MLDVLGYQTAGILQGKGCPGPDAVPLDRAVKAFQLAVALGVIVDPENWTTS